MRRRDILASILGAPFAATALAACDDEPVVPEIGGELLGPSVDLGHLLRRGSVHPESPGTARRVGVAIIGAGPAGLSAAWQLRRRGIDDVVVLELEPQPGGTSSAGQSDVTPYPWGAHYLPVPRADQRVLCELLEEMGAVSFDDHGRPVGDEALLVRAPHERVFYRGFWYRGIFPRVGATTHDLAQLERFERIVRRWVTRRDSEGRRTFDLPSRRCSDTAEDLDSITASAWCTRQGFTSPRLLWWLEYGTRDDYGLSLEDASAWSLLFYHAARVSEATEESADFLTWPDGNGAIVNHLARPLGERIESDSLVTRVIQNEAHVTLTIVDASSEQRRAIEAERVICAVPRFVAARIVESAHDASDASYGSWVVANLHLRSRPGERGFAPCWDNVLYDSPSLGYVSATHQRGRDFGPTVWTYYLPLLDADPRAARQRLLDHDHAHYKEAIVADLGRAHPDLPQHLEKIDVWRWGHAMVQPRVGMRASMARRNAARPIGRVHFAHSDLSGLALFEEAFDHGVRAADEVADAREAS